MMSDPRAPQRRDNPATTFENIQDRLFRKFPARVATGDYRPIWGHVQNLPDGRPGGQPITPPMKLMEPIRFSAMPPAPTPTANKRRTLNERMVNAEKFLAKPRITLLQLDKPTALDAANRVRYRPAVGDKPAPPVNWNGGYWRVRERDTDHPKNTAVSMKPISTLESRWQKTQLPTSSVPSSAAVRFPKTL